MPHSAVSDFGNQCLNNTPKQASGLKRRLSLIPEFGELEIVV